MMGLSLGDTERESVHEKLLSLFEKAGYEVIYPKVYSQLLFLFMVWGDGCYLDMQSIWILED